MAFRELGTNKKRVITGDSDVSNNPPVSPFQGGKYRNFDLHNSPLKRELGRLP